MKFLRFVPRVQLCCYCIKLKIGCIIIAAIHIIFVVESFLNVGGNDEFSRCYTSKTLTRLISYVSLLISVTLIAAIAYLLYGIYKSIAEPVLWFMYITIVLLLYNIFISLLLFTSNKSEKGCSPGYVLGGVTLLATLLQVYILLILANYYRELQPPPELTPSKGVSPRASISSKDKDKDKDEDNDKEKDIDTDTDTHKDKVKNKNKDKQRTSILINENKTTS
ncbi:unnamed protein product [Spodoptera littoralis]|uniref:Uncharacterized protein n=1 Tax=Spodoptera littoralis TaxID=7109 RepID=A0A9P0HUN5_SPOLI|nr:unnamed protein product [Spodoptera littoralis]CAH1635646.1 unnamed protein product [Spodoptera littoralis]